MMPLEVQKRIQLKLQQNGHRLTCQRLTILNVLFDHDFDHMGAKEIYRDAKQHSSQISIATVYRTVLFLEEAGILNRIRTNDNHGRCELIHPDGQNGHPHLVCTRCKEPIDIVDNQIMRLLEACCDIIQSRYGFDIDAQNILYHGLCYQCRSRQ